MATNRSTMRRPDLKTVRRALVLVQAVPPWDPWTQGAPHSSRADRAKLSQSLLEDLRTSLTDLERLQAEFIPEARIASPCGWCRGPTHARSPLLNFIHCYDVCVICREEATRALRLVERGLLGEDVRGMFLPDTVIAARILAAHAEEDRKDRVRSARPRFEHALSENEDGDPVFSLRREGSGTRPGSDPQNATWELAQPLNPYARHLITWADMVGYLQKHSIRDVPKTLKKVRAAAPKPIWASPSHRSLYRLGAALKAARVMSEEQDLFAKLSATTWLRTKLHPPDHRPPWAGTSGDDPPAAQRTGREATPKRRSSD